MKRLFANLFLAVALCAVISVSLCGCGAEPIKSETLYVTISPLRPLVEGIVGDDFDVEILVPTGASPESFEPTPRQFIALNSAQAVFAVGLIEFERNLISRIAEQRKVVDLSSGIELIAGSCSHNHNHSADCAHSHHRHGVDPHIWSSPKALKQMAQNVYSSIAALYPDSVKYKTNYETLVTQLDSLDMTVQELCDGARTREFIIYHPALTYLARDYGLEQISIEHEGKEPSAKRLTGIIEGAKAGGIKRLFYQSTYPRSSVAVVAEDIGAEPVEIDPLREDIFANIVEITRLITE